MNNLGLSCQALATLQTTNELVQLRQRMNTALTETRKLLSQMERKYDSLVAYARKPRNDTTHPAYEFCRDMERDFPEETSQLNCINDSDWNHGFNSGMLASTRLFKTFTETDPEAVLLLDDDAEEYVEQDEDLALKLFRDEALEMFPDLNT